MTDVFVNSKTLNPGAVIADAIRGRSYSQVKIIRLINDNGKHCTILEHICDKLIITYRGFISCDPVDVKIDTLIFQNWIQKSNIPKFLMDCAKYITIVNIHGAELPPEIDRKIKLVCYRNATKHDIKPNSKYSAEKVSDFDGLELGNVSKLTLKANYEDLTDMVNFLNCCQDKVFKEITVLYKFAERNRTFAPFFDLSTLANIKAAKISLNDSKYIGFRKFVSLTTIPYISWVLSADLRHHRSLIGTIKAELVEDMEADIENNYTLLRFAAVDVYGTAYKDVSKLVARNKQIHSNKRFAITKSVQNIEEV